VLFHIPQRRFGLGHGPLSGDLPAEKKVEPVFHHHFSGKAKHQGMAVHAGVHVLAVSAAGGFEHLEVGFGDRFFR
jgi:hypothetical protein